jgi:tRNA(Ile)-lysidine synthase
VVDWQNRVETSIVSRNLIRPGQRILVAVSGGVDSMVLLHALAALSKTHAWKIVVAHFNHQLRADSSDKDEQLVRRTARSLKLPVVVGRGDVRELSRRKKVSIEMAARELRHEFLARAARTNRAACVALAHHLDDQVELFFVRLFRGTGVQGLSGMKWSSASPSDSRVTLIRPFLNSNKSDLLAYARARKIMFRRDASNGLLRFQRNRIRNKLLPQMEREYSQRLRAIILRSMDVLSAETEFVEETARTWLLTAAPEKSKASKVDKMPATYRSTFSPDLGARPFDQLPLALQRRCIHIQLIEQGINPDYELIERLRLNSEKPMDVTYAREDKSQANSQPSSLRIQRCLSGLVQKTPVQATRFKSGSCMLHLDRGVGSKAWDGVEFSWKVLAASGSIHHPGQGAEVFDADRVGMTVELRHWRPGDRFHLIGMEKSAKLQDIFTNQRVPRARRTELVVAATEKGEIFWVEGLRISERFKLTQDTNRRLHWAWQRL